MASSIGSRSRPGTGQGARQVLADFVACPNRQGPASLAQPAAKSEWRKKAPGSQQKDFAILEALATRSLGLRGEVAAPVGSGSVPGASKMLTATSRAGKVLWGPALFIQYEENRWRLSFTVGNTPADLDQNKERKAVRGALQAALEAWAPQPGGPTGTAAWLKTCVEVASVDKVWTDETGLESRFVADLQLKLPPPKPGTPPDQVKAAEGQVGAAATAVLTAASFPVAFAAALEEQLTLVTRAAVAVPTASCCCERPNELELRGGWGEPVFVVSVPEGSHAARRGICEGFELVGMETLDPRGSVWTPVADFKDLPGEQIVAEGKFSLPLRLMFRSPLSSLPNLSEKQVAERVGLRRIKEFHLHRLIQELRFTWEPIVVKTDEELRRIQAATEDEEGQEVIGNAGHDEGLLYLRAPVKLLNVTLTEDSYLRKAPDLEGNTALSELRPGSTPLPVQLEVGKIRDPSTLKLSTIQAVLRRAGVRWLTVEQEKLLMQSLSPSDEDIDQYGEDAWEMLLADNFVIDSAGAFVNVVRPIQPYHVLNVSKKLEAIAQSRRAGFGTVLSVSDFETAMHLGGIDWFTPIQLKKLYNGLKGRPQGMTVADWTSRFSWDPAQMSMEVDKALKVFASEIRGSARRKHKSELRLSFSQFQRRLHQANVHWLSLDQQRLIFDTIDLDHNGFIDSSELRQLVERRGWLEGQREAAAMEAAEQLRAVMEEDQSEGGEVSPVAAAPAESPSYPPAESLSYPPLLQEEEEPFVDGASPPAVKGGDDRMIITAADMTVMARPEDVAPAADVLEVPGASPPAPPLLEPLPAPESTKAAEDAAGPPETDQAHAASEGSVHRPGSPEEEASRPESDSEAPGPASPGPLHGDDDPADGSLTPLSTSPQAVTAAAEETDEEPEAVPNARLYTPSEGSAASREGAASVRSVED